MNRTILLCARIVVALLLLVGVMLLVGFLIWRPVTLSPDAKVIVVSAIGQLLILLGFAIHAIFAPGAQVPESAPFPNSPGPTAPKA